MKKDWLIAEEDAEWRNLWDRKVECPYPPEYAKRLRLQLAKLEAAKGPRDMNLPGWRLHALKGSLKGHWAVWVDQNWRMIFRFEHEDAVLVDYQGYH